MAQPCEFFAHSLPKYCDYKVTMGPVMSDRQSVLNKFWFWLGWIGLTCVDMTGADPLIRTLTGNEAEDTSDVMDSRL